MLFIDLAYNFVQNDFKLDYFVVPCEIFQNEYNKDNFGLKKNIIPFVQIFP